MARQRAAAARRSCGLDAGTDSSSADDLSCGSRSIVRSIGSSFKRGRFVGLGLPVVSAAAVRSCLLPAVFLELARVSEPLTSAGTAVLTESTDLMFRLLFLAEFEVERLAVGKAAAGSETIGGDTCSGGVMAPVTLLSGAASEAKSASVT